MSRKDTQKRKYRRSSAKKQQQVDFQYVGPAIPSIRSNHTYKLNN